MLKLVIHNNEKERMNTTDNKNDEYCPELRQETKDRDTATDTVKQKIAKLVSELEQGKKARKTFADVEALADEVLNIFGYGKGGAVPVVKLTKRFGFYVARGTMLPNPDGSKIDGNITISSKGTEKKIKVSNLSPLEHRRFVIAHEFGHYLLDYLGTDIQKGNMAFSRPYTDHDSCIVQNQENELLADRFAAELLMPKHSFLEEYQNAWREEENMIFVISYLAAYFQVKKSSVVKRIKELKLVASN